VVKAVEALVVLAVLGVLFMVAVVLVGERVGKWLARQRRAHADWELVEESNGEQVVVYAERPGQDRLLIGAATFAAIDFDVQLWELRSKGREQVYALNQGSHR